AVRAGDVIRILQMRTDRHSHGFLTDVGVQGAHDFALAGLVFRLLLEEANAPHARIDGFESVCGRCLDRHWHILHVTVANTRGRALRFLRPHSGAKGAMLPAPTQWRQGRYASCAHTVAPERRSWASCTMCVYVLFILALIAARVNGRPKTLEHS